MDEATSTQGDIVEQVTYTFDELARESAEIRNPFFEQAAQNRRISSIILEKDFWVCWTLRRLFEDSALADRLVFKGGTSLSKVYDVIERFSEDIDILIDRETFGFAGDDDVNASQTKSARERTLHKIDDVVHEYVGETLLRVLATSFRRHLPAEDWSLRVDPEDESGATLLFAYPGGFAADELSYIRRVVRMEFGGRPDKWPAEQRTIRAYVAGDFPRLITDADTLVHVLSVHRTFWEKATILHAYAHFPDAKVLPARSSRHFYDLSMMSKMEAANAALADQFLLKAVVENKTLFYPDNKASYETALPGSFVLLPSTARLTDLERDYREMQPMFFTKPPLWSEIVTSLEVLQGKINA